MPPITVLMSVYNGIPYLNEAIESILSQTYQDFEFLIIDDASDDGSLDILKDYAEKDPRIRIIQNTERMGLGKNLAKGVDEAKGIWIARADADDVYLPQRLQTQMDFASSHSDIDIIGSWAVDIDEHGKELGERRCPVTHEQIAKYIWTCPILHTTVFFKKESILKAGSYGGEKRRQDYALWFRALKSGLKFTNIDQPLAKYRFADSYFKRNNVKALLNQLLIGWKGCWMVGASPTAYIGVAVPFFRGIMPNALQRPISRIIKRFDPRNVAAS